MQNLNSDQLRRQLDENSAAMNTLADNNQKIVELLAQRGLQAVDPAGDDISIHPCIMQLDKLQSEPKPLTAEELEAGGWWCADVSEECRLALVGNGVNTDEDYWDDSRRDRCAYKSGSSLSVIRTSMRGDEIREIHRIGNNFYWGAPSDQAN